MAITKLIGTDPNQVPVNGMLGTLAFQEDVNFDALTNKTAGTGNYTTTGNFTGAALIPTGATVPTNGMYLPAAGSVALSTGSAERLRIDNTGRVGIGTSSPGAVLHVAGEALITGNLTTTLGSLSETVYTVTDGSSVDLDPANGPIQVWTLGANRTPTATNFAAGESMMLMVDDGTSYTITWPTITWVGGSAPTLATSGYTVVELWKVSTTLYGAHVGDVA